MKTVGAKQQNGSKRAGTVFLNGQAQRIQDFVQRNTGGDHLKKTLFTGEQRFPPLAFRNVEHSPHYFNEIAGWAENRMTSALDLPDGATWMDNAIFKFNVNFLTDG